MNLNYQIHPVPNAALIEVLAPLGRFVKSFVRLTGEFNLFVKTYRNLEAMKDLLRLEFPEGKSTLRRWSFVAANGKGLDAVPETATVFEMWGVKANLDDHLQTVAQTIGRMTHVAHHGLPGAIEQHPFTSRDEHGMSIGGPTRLIAEVTVIRIALGHFVTAWMDTFPKSNKALWNELNASDKDEIRSYLKLWMAINKSAKSMWTEENFEWATDLLQKANDFPVVRGQNEKALRAALKEIVAWRTPNSRRGSIASPRASSRASSRPAEGQEAEGQETDNDGLFDSAAPNAPRGRKRAAGNQGGTKRAAKRGKQSESEAEVVDDTDEGARDDSQPESPKPPRHSARLSGSVAAAHASEPVPAGAEEDGGQAEIGRPRKRGKADNDEEYTEH
jgi:hypothetical protein